MMQKRCCDHAQVCLPPLTPNEALLFVNLLEKICQALWHAHGAGMAELLQRVVDAHVERNLDPLPPSSDPQMPAANDDLPF